MPRILLTLVVIIFLLGSISPLTKAQTEPNEEDDQNQQIFLPIINNDSNTTSEPDLDIREQSTEIGPELLRPSQRTEDNLQLLPNHLAALKLKKPEMLDSGLMTNVGRQQVVVRLRTLSVLQHLLRNVTASSPAAQLAQLAEVQKQQAALVATAVQMDAATLVLGQVQKALNAVILEIDVAALPALAAHPAVLSLRPVINYSLALTSTIPYVGGRAVQALGYDGTGVAVAVLDSGIDYTHANLGGPGTLAAYAAAYGTALTDTLHITRSALFPTPKVVEGYDFVGESWPIGPLAPDDDPIDFDGHGTHVADIIGGLHGMAPAVDLYALKVCSATANTCSGVALLQAMDFALDPNGDGSMSDAVDVINLSLGNDYGTEADDDLSLAVEYASAYGVVVVAAAGNGSDKPYVHSTPASAPSAIAVAQTHVPTAEQGVMTLIAPPSIAGFYAAAFQPWSTPLSTAFEAPIQYADGNGGNLLGCAPFTTGSLAGKIILVDRGDCTISVKISNIAAGSGSIGLVGLIAPGVPSSFAFGGGAPTIPGYVISQDAADRIRSEVGNGVVARFEPTTTIPLVKHMVASSSRGPSVSGNLIKPDIGAPGASVSAVVGTGSGEAAFSGTSGAAPLVAGAVALLRQAFPQRSAAELKALLQNTAETNIMNSPALLGGELAPITRIGGGELRVERAIASPAAAWDSTTQGGSLSFSFQDVIGNDLELTRQVTVRNYSTRTITYSITQEFRFPDDEASGAVGFHTPITLFVPARGDAQFEVGIKVWGDHLPAWSMNSGEQGADPAPLTRHEYDGYLQLTETDNVTNTIHLAWHLLPRRASHVSVSPRNSFVRVSNRGVATTTVESYSLLGISSNLPQGGPGDENPTPDFRYFGYSTFVAPIGLCNATQESFVLAFAANTWERQTHANVPVSYRIGLDTNQDGIEDYRVLTRDQSFTTVTDGRNYTWVANRATNTASAFFFTDHETNSANTVMLVCAEQIGLSKEITNTAINLSAFVDDRYYGGMGDGITGITLSPFGEQYVGNFEQGGVGVTTLGPEGEDRLTVLDFGPSPNRTEQGLLLFFRGGAEINREAGTVVILP